MTTRSCGLGSPTCCRSTTAFGSSPKPTGGLISQRELEVLGLIRQGFSNDEIARLLGISERTVRAHVTALLVNLNAADRAQAVARGFELGLLKIGASAGA